MIVVDRPAAIRHYSEVLRIKTCGCADKETHTYRARNSTTTRTEVQLVTRPDKGGYTLVTLPRTVTPYRDSVDGTRHRLTYQKLVTR